MISQPLTSQDFVMSQVPSEDMPSYLSTYPALLRLDNLMITNFKSFQQETFTGPFLGFTSIIGPNGSGKSNVLDALMFCLCGENLKHNFFDLRQYINRDKAQTYRDMSQKKKKCIVQANFLLQNSINLSLKRQIDAEGVEIFSIDYHQVPKKIYENFLFRHGINPQIPNYAITQGEIDKLLMRQPIQLSHYIESLSGSVAYKREYDNTKNEIDQTSRRIVQTTQKISKLKGDKKNAKNINLASKECEQLQQEYQETLKKLFTLKVHIKQLDIQTLTIEIQKKKHEEKQRIDEINKRKLKFQQQIKQKQQLNKQMNICQRKIIQLRNILKGMNKPDQLMKNKQMQTYQRQVKQIQEQIQFINQKRIKLNNQIPQVHGTQVIQQYLSLYSQWQNKNRTTKLELDNKKTLYFNLQAQNQFQRSLLDSQMERQKKQKLQLQKRKSEIALSKQQINQIGQLIQKLKKQSSQSQLKHNKSLNLLTKQKQQYQRLCNQVQNFEQLMTQSIDNQKDKQIIKRLGVLQGFYGQVQQKIRPTHDKYIIAFSILTSAISKYLLAKDQKCSKLVANKLKDMNSIKTLIILSNIKRNHQQRTDIKQSLGKLGSLALDIIDFQKNIEGFQQFLKQFSRGKVICEDLKNAFQIRDKKIPGVKQIITLNGQVLKSDGMITSYGNTQNLKKSYKLGSNKKSFQAQLRKAIQSRDQIKQKVQKLQKDCRPQQQIRRNNQILKLQRTKQQLSQKIQYLGSIKPKQIKSLKNIMNDMSILQQKLSKVSQQISLIQKSMSKQNYISEFMKKHKIQNLQSFRSSSNLQVLQQEVKQKTKLLKQIDELDELKQVYKRKHQQKKYKYQQLKEQLKKTQGTKSRNNIEKQIQKQQQKLKSLRQQIAKLAVFKDINIQLRSEVIQMQAKFKYTQQKHRQFIKDLQAQYGVVIQYPITKEAYKKLQDYIANGSLGDVSRKRLQKAIKDLQSQKNLTQQKLQKLNSIDLLQKNHNSRKQAQIMEQIKTLSALITSQSLKRDQLLKSHQIIKKQRKDRYSLFFEQLKINLSQSYEILTQIRPDLKGKADLYLENSQLPFDYGVYFTPTPPTKRFVYDLEQLSGGQKSIASLALQYALAITSKAPFFILDQSDAFLDLTNSQKLLNLVKNSFKDKQLQIILITHKPSIYQKCESVVGVTRPKHQFSQVFSMRLVQKMQMVQNESS